MRLQIKNIAKVKEADIVIDGVTVLAGLNNTGKSTIGKVLYSMFNSLYDLDRKIANQRRNAIANTLENVFQSTYESGMYFGQDPEEFYNFLDKMARDLMNVYRGKELLEQSEYKSDVVKLFNKRGINYDKNPDFFNEFLDESFPQIKKFLNSDNHVLGTELIERYFASVFNEQWCYLKNQDMEAQASLQVKGKDIVISFLDNHCTGWNADIKIAHEAFFIDDPFILDDYRRGRIYFGSGARSLRDELREKLRRTPDIMDGIFDAVNAKENLQEIYKKLSDVTSDFTDLGVQRERKLNLNNLSAGVKSFMLIKMLLEKGILKEKDVLILDEPEIHLHPEWQLVYAEIIVLLHKMFDLSIIVTTHSSHFLEAIDIFSEKHGIESKCNYYLAREDEKDEFRRTVFDNVTESKEDVYLQMVSPSMALDKLREEIRAEYYD